MVLHNIIPDSAFPTDGAYPLSIDDFRHAILIPEAATALIMEDRDVDHYTAIQTMISSGRYGTVFFAHNGEDEYDEMLNNAFPPVPVEPTTLENCSGGVKIEVSGVKSEVTTADADVEVSGDGYRVSSTQALGGPKVEVSCKLGPEASGEVGPEASGEGGGSMKSADCAPRRTIGEADELLHRTLQPGQVPSGQESTRTRVRRRRMPRSSIPLILTESNEDGRDSDQEGTPSSKKARLE